MSVSIIMSLPLTLNIYLHTLALYLSVAHIAVKYVCIYFTCVARERPSPYLALNRSFAPSLCFPNLYLRPRKQGGVYIVTLYCIVLYYCTISSHNHNRYPPLVLLASWLKLGSGRTCKETWTEVSIYKYQWVRYAEYWSKQAVRGGPTGKRYHLPLPDRRRLY